MQSKNVKCEADEYPPAAFWQGARHPKQYIRFAPGRQNGGAGSLFKLGFCDYHAHGLLPVETLDKRYVSDKVEGNIRRRVTEYFARTTRSQVSIAFDDDVQDPDGIAGLRDNLYWPKRLVNDPGFALLIDDPYYARDRNAQGYGRAHYPGPVPPDVRQGKPPKDKYRKRHDEDHELDPDAWVFDDGNTTRPVADDELESVLGIVRCSSADCREEMEALEVESAPVFQPEATGHPGPQLPNVLAASTLVTSRHTRTTASEDGLAHAGNDAGTHESFAPPRETGGVGGPR